MRVPQLNVYLDVCCLVRPFDDQNQPRIRLEAEAILLILENFESGDWLWTGSEVMEIEIGKTPNLDQRQRVQLLLRSIGRKISMGNEEEVRATELVGLGFKEYDARHLACAELGRCDVFLTTDDRLLRLARRVSTRLRLRVENPLAWLQEVSGS